MERKMKLEAWFSGKNIGGGKLEHDILYQGSDLTDIAEQIDRDNNEILYYMRTGDFKKEKCFCFGGLMIKKAGLVAIKLSEADF